MWSKIGAASFILAGIALPATAEQPLSAIDWLSQSVTTPAAMPLPAPEAQSRTRPIRTGNHHPLAPRNLTPERIAVQSLDAPHPDATGLLSAKTAGLPYGLWGSTPEAELTRMLRAERVDTLPTVQSLLYTLLLAELAPPLDADAQGSLLLARVDRLLDFGALDQAAELLSQAGTEKPDLFRRAFDIALLRGDEDRYCETMLKSPGIAPTLTARIFCLARGGDWNAAAVTLRTAEALGQVKPDENALLSRFLDPDLYEGEPSLPQPSRPSPLVWRMFEALGEPIPTGTLPPAFANADMRSNSGWKQQLDAAERLARTGAVAPAQLFALYEEGSASASGGVWDRVSAIQDLEAALAKGDADAVTTLLPSTWSIMVEAELEVPFAEIYAPALLKLPLEGEAARLSHQIGLLSAGFETVAKNFTAETDEERFAQGLAKGDVTGLATRDGMTRAIAAGFAATAITDTDRALIDGNRRGEALLHAIDRITDGVKGDLRDVSDALALLRHMGLETQARRIALELMLLERRG